jgi:alkylation response protein AidB-like acyl-CoA dehydrogenase
MEDLFSAPFERLLADACTPATVRAIESGASAAALWETLSASGFADLLVAEAAGGAGLSLHAAGPLFDLCGRHALPVPLSLTMVVRAALAAQPDGATALEALGGGSATIAPATAGNPAAATAPGTDTMGGTAGGSSSATIRRANVPYGMLADWVVIEHAGRTALWPASEARIEPDGIHASLDASLAWTGVPAGALPLPGADWQALAACVLACEMAGAMGWVLDATLAYANERTQFGRPIGKFQALQQQISAFAERVFATRMAARIGCPANGWRTNRNAAAAAKGYASEAAVLAAGVAHAVHGAIGITAEYDLQLYTRRLAAWRRAYGAESYWYTELGAAWLDGEATALDFVRAELAPALAAQAGA